MNTAFVAGAEMLAVNGTQESVCLVHGTWAGGGFKRGGDGLW